MDIVVVQNFGVALILSFLIGLEREQKSGKNGDLDFGGVRTFSLIGLLGAATYYFSSISIYLSGVLALGFAGLLIGSYIMFARNTKNMGLTTEISALMVFAIGVISAMGNYFFATLLTLVVMAILHFKMYLHKWAWNLSNNDIIATLQFILIAFIVLPLLPNEAFGPYGFFNPYVAWLMVVLISGLSFMSYIAMKLFGEKRGIGITGFLAGFISSTALALSFSEESKKNKSVVNPYVVAIIVASSAMFFRILAEVAVISPDLTTSLLMPMVVMGVSGILISIFFWIQKEKIPNKLSEKISDVKSPFSLIPALQFGVFFVGISLLTNVAGDLWGDQGIFASSVFSGILDVDAITVSISNAFNRGDILGDVAVRAITLAAMTNTLVKGGIFILFAGSKAGRKVFVSMLLIIALGEISMTIF